MSVARAVELKVFEPDHKKFTRYRFPAPNGQMFSDETVIDVLANMLVLLGKQWPSADLTLIKVGKAKWNVVHQVGNA